MASRGSSHICINHPVYRCPECCRRWENRFKTDLFLKTDRFEFWKDKLPNSSLTSRTMFKGPTSYTSTKDEFDAMVLMYEILGDNAVKPMYYSDIGPWNENQREAYDLPANTMKGEYWMEKIGGWDLQHLINIAQRKIENRRQGKKSKNPERESRQKTQLANIRLQIQTIRDKLAETDFEHGDISASNLLIEKQTGKVKLIDPSGVRKESRTAIEENDSDETRFADLLDRLDEILYSKW